MSKCGLKCAISNCCVMVYNLIPLIFVECDDFFHKCNFFKNIFSVASINTGMKGEKAGDLGG